ncbi:hypothetical protein [Hoeflea sp. IMCC20628]|uniref:hypothetical protein n=1 Tax=Hoeflea sp. IMCC20628 TaxID=1620421 RepID=UPI0012E04D87|nr:hypothetical protein [Hoeflea sp. IMCC20628]
MASKKVLQPVASIGLGELQRSVPCRRIAVSGLKDPKPLRQAAALHHKDQMPLCGNGFMEITGS